MVSANSDASASDWVDPSDAPEWDDSTLVRDRLEGHPLYKSYAFGDLTLSVAKEAKKAPVGQRYQYLDRGLLVVEAVMLATNEDGYRYLDQTEGCAKPSSWYHKGRTRLAGKARLDPYISTCDTQSAAALYLNMPFRVAALDRILLDMLIASEMFAFVDEVQPVLKRKIPLLLRWLLNNLCNSILASLLLVFIIWLDDWSPAITWASIILLGVLLIGIVWSIFAYPFFYPTERARHKKIEDIVSAMLDAYGTLAGKPASTQHIEEQVRKATDKGAVWPSQLIVFLEDIRKRSSTV